MNIGFSELDNIINIERPQVILLKGPFREQRLLSANICNNVCIEQNIPVLQIIGGYSKEYLLQRFLVNQANVDMYNWYQKDKYTEMELKHIGQTVVDSIQQEKKLPTVIEEVTLNYDRKQIKQVVYNFAKRYKSSTTRGLIVLDLFELNDRYSNKAIKIIKDMIKISKRTQCTIIITTNKDKFKKYISTVIEIKNNHQRQDQYFIYDLEVFQKNKLMGTAKLKYDIKIRKFKNND